MLYCFKRRENLPKSWWDSSKICLDQKSVVFNDNIYLIGHILWRYMDWVYQAYSFYVILSSYIIHRYLLLCLQSNILQVNVSISSRDNYCIDIVLRCLAIAGDGLGPQDFNDGGILSTIMAAGFKGNNCLK